ncbi:MAG TPA: hypothetical protein VE861_02680 [Gemmatimonadaceae bacterium]|nr:hypothetical protein [Gemmatimonadaceae bacterium]
MKTRAMRVGCALIATIATPAVSPARAQDGGATHLVVIAGVSGEARIGTEWHGMSMALATAATQKFGIPAQRVVVLEQDSTLDGGRVQGRSSKATIEKVLGGLARSLTASDRLVVVMMAHGSSLGAETRVNLPGPDMTPSDFARVLAPATSPTIAFVHTGSASGEFATALDGPRRIVITATKSAREQNETIFPGPFVRAITTDSGDTDKDGRVSLLEAFTYAQHEVEQVFAKGNLIATEHSVLTDGAEGGRARTFFLGAGGSSAAPATAAALAARADIQARIDALRARRSTMEEDAYLKALEPLIVELAQRTRALRVPPPPVKP